MKAVKRVLVVSVAVAFLVLSVGATPYRGYDHAGWEFVERLGTVWLQRGDPIPLAEGELCDDIPQLEYITSEAVDLPQPQTGSSEVEQGLYETFLKGKWSVRVLHIWGVYSDIGCKEPLGWGTAFLIDQFLDTSIWVTVEHNVLTGKYFQTIFGREIATNWYIKDEDGHFRELFPVGCKDGKYCVLLSRYVHGTSPIALGEGEERIINDVHVLEPVYLYGCSLIVEAVQRYEHYKLMFFCLGASGIVNSRNSLDTLAGGDLLVSAPAMPGFSGSPLFVYREGKLWVVGTVNSGVEGVFTAVNLVRPGTVSKTVEWLRRGKSLYNNEEEP